MITEKKYHPSYPLSQYVDFIWLGKSPQLDLEASHHAPLFTELIFNYGDHFQVSGQNIENIYNKYDHKILSGLKTTPFHSKVSGSYSSVGLILKPFCYGMIINKFGTREMDEISEILFEHVFEPTQANFEVVESHLLSLFEDKSLDKDLFKFEQFISSNLLEKGVLRDFNDSINISQKSFIQKFKRYYFIRPIEYLKLRKVNRAIQQINSDQAGKLTDIGLEAGFYDQSHFIRLFKKFCGCTPKEFKKISLG